MAFKWKRAAYAGGILWLVSSAWTQTVPGQTDRPDAAALANSLSQLKSLVTDQNFGKMGFLSRAEAASAVYGLPIRRYLVRADKLNGFDAATDPAAIFEDTRQWIYPVLANGNVRCAVTLSWRAPGGWKATAFGDQGLARAVSATRSEEAKRLHPPREELFFLLDVVSAGRKFIGRRTDGEGPDRLPGRQRIVLTWLSRPPGANSKTDSAERILVYLSGEVKRRGIRGPA